MVIRSVEAEDAKALALLHKIVFYENYFTASFSAPLQMKYFNLKNNFVQIETNENCIKFGKEIVFG